MRRPGIELSGEDQEFLIESYWKPYQNLLKRLHKDEDDFLSNTMFRVTKLGRLDRRTTKAEIEGFTFPGKEYLQQYTWGRKKIKRKR